MTDLTPANQNPWYVLMTLFGEQDGKTFDWKLHEENLSIWNAWVDRQFTGKLTDIIFLDKSKEHFPELNFTKAPILEEAHKLIMDERNKDVGHYEYVALNVEDVQVDLSCIWLAHNLALKGMNFPHGLALRSSHIGGRANFQDTTFGGPLSCANASFQDNVTFDSAKFDSTARFAEARFGKKADFANAVFQDTVSFFKSSFAEVSFWSATFEKRTDFNEATFEGRVTLTSAQFKSPTSFKKASFESEYPQVAGTVFHGDTEFTADNHCWPNPKRGEQADAKEACAKIRHNQSQQGLAEEEHFFFRREMHFSGRGEGALAQLPYRAFGWFSGYGHSISKPLDWLAGLMGVGGGAIFAHLADKYEALQALGLSFAMSFSNLLPIFGFSRTFLREELLTLPPALQAISGAQTVLSLPLLFFLGLGLRTRFRLR